MSEHETAYDEAEIFPNFQTQLETALKTQLEHRTLIQQLKVDIQRLTEINGQLQDEVRILHKVIDILHEKKYSITEPNNTNNTNYYRVDQPMQPMQTTPFIYPVGPSDPNPYNPYITC